MLTLTPLDNLIWSEYSLSVINGCVLVGDLNGPISRVVLTDLRWQRVKQLWFRGAEGSGAHCAKFKCHDRRAAEEVRMALEPRLRRPLS